MLSKALVVGAYQRKAEELASLPDVELTVIVPPFWCEAGRRIELEKRYTRGYDLVVEDMFLNGSFHLHFYPGLGRQVRRIKPHVFHIDEEPYNVATLQAVKLAGEVQAKPLFFTWQNIYRRMPPPFNLVESYNLERSHLAIAGSEGARQVLLRKGFRKRIAVIPQFGVDPELYSPGQEIASRATAAALSRRFVVGYVGRVVEAKGLTALVEAVAGMTGRWELRVIGEGKLKPFLQQRVQDLGIADQVSFLPAVPSGQVPRHLRELDVLVLPSITTPSWKEQFGRVLIEAMACQVPVIGSDSGEIPVVVGDAGLVFREGDVVDLRDKLTALANDIGLRERLARAGRQRVLARFTQARIAEETYSLYRWLTGSERQDDARGH